MENERRARSGIQAEYTAFMEENKIGEGLDSRSAKDLARQNKELEEENRIL